MKLNKQHANAIAGKLKAEINTKRSTHDRADIYFEDKLIAHFSIRRGSNKDAGHGHIPSDLNISPKDARRLAECPMSKEEWINLMKQKGLID